jgi:quercetin dioxygenase-like cupin family protein
MVSLESKSFDAPDEVRPFTDKGGAQVVKVAGSSVLKVRYEPGWRWSEHVRPIAGTDSCQSTHSLYVLSGRMHLAMNDGTTAEIGPNEVVHIEPGHDAWVLGDEPCITVDFGASPAYAAKNA